MDSEMNLYSSLLGYAEHFAVPEEYIVDDLQQLIFGSLPRPPESRMDFGSFIVAVHSWLIPLFSKKASHSLAYRDYVVGVGAVWHNLEARYAHREGKLRLESLEQPIGPVIDNGCLVLLLEHLGLWFRTHGLMLLPRDCNEDSLIVNFQPCKFTNLSLFMKTFIGCFEELMVSIAKRLIVLDGSHNQFMVSKSSRQELQELNSLYQLLEIVQELLVADLVGSWSLRDEFQRDNGHFKTIRIALDQCYFLLVCFCPSNLFQASFVLQKKNFRHGCIPHPMS